MNFVKLFSDKALILLDCAIWGEMGIMEEWLVWGQMLMGFEYQVEVFQIFVILKSLGWNEIELII